MAKKIKDTDSEVLSYRHSDRRKNNPEVGMVSPDTDPDQPKTTYSYDPHIDPALQFDSKRFQIEKLIDDALTSGDQNVMQQALEQLKRQQDPYLNWSGKAEKTSYEVDTVSLHVHERIDPASILSAVRRGMKKEKSAKSQSPSGQLGLFNAPFENLPLRDAIDFYKHDRGWANRLIAGDSLLVMNSLLQKEGMAGQVQMVFFDPPYGIKYGSNFQPFIDKRDVKDGKDEDLTQEPEMLKAFRDTWELGIHSYLTYLRDRIQLAHQLLNETGSIFIQISDENLHHIREICDEVFDAKNFQGIISFTKTAGGLATKSRLSSRLDYLIWYAKDSSKVFYRQLYEDREDNTDAGFNLVIDKQGFVQSISEFGAKELTDDYTLVRSDSLTKPGPGSKYKVKWEGVEYDSGNRWWGMQQDSLIKLLKLGRARPFGNTIRYLKLLSDFSLKPLNNLWDGFAGAKNPVYVVQTNEDILERCLLMTTRPGDLTLDPTCGSGTTALVSERLGRRWITCDSSRVALTLTKARLMTASYDYFALKYPHEGLKGDFIYTSLPYVTPSSITGNQDLDTLISDSWEGLDKDVQSLNKLTTSTYGLWNIPELSPEGWSSEAKKLHEELVIARDKFYEASNAKILSNSQREDIFNKPIIEKDKLRITGPFTVEAVPSPMVQSLDETTEIFEADQSVSRSGESQRHHNWKDELIKTGIRGKNNQMLMLTDLETLPEVKYIHASGTVAETGERVVVSFGPEYSLLEQRQVEMAMREAGELFPRPKMILFCGFDFDPEAAKDIDSTKGIIALRVKMNADLLTDDLKKQRSSNQSFWLMGQPDIQVKKIKDDKWQVEVYGFDYFDTVKGELISGGKGNIASWMLDTDYDSRSLFPKQVFFPMAGSKDGWSKLKKEIKAELDQTALAKFSGTTSLPFEAGDFKKIAVKIVDDRGIESLKVLDLED